MQQDKNIQNWIDCWNASNGNPDKMNELGSSEIWNQRAENFAKKLNLRKRQKQIQEMSKLLDEVGFRAKGARVLDIGCGPGAISIPLARAGASVTSLDISYKALEHLKGTSEKEGLSIEPVECSWWSADIDELGFRNRFDLVIVSMTPSVKDVQTFVRMIDCSRKYCYYSHFLPCNWEKKQGDIDRTFFDKKFARPPDQMMSLFMYNFMYLYLNGYRPLVRINHEQRKREVDTGEAADREIHSINNEETCTERKNRNNYGKSAGDGKYIPQSDVYIGTMVWNVNR